MPRRPEHPPFAVDVTNDHPIVAHDLVIALGQPNPRGGRLSGTRLSDKKLSPAVAVDDAATVQLDAAPAPEEVRDGDLVEWVVESVHLVVERLDTNENASVRKIAIEQRHFVRHSAEHLTVA